MRHRIACVLLFVAALQSLAIADETPRWSAAELASHSDVMLTGRVADLAASREAGPRYTYVTLDVDDVLKGSVPQRQVILKQLERAGEASFVRGEAVLVFLTARPGDRTLSTTAGWQGKWIVTADARTGDRIASRAIPGANDRGPFGTRVDALSLQALRGGVDVRPADGSAMRGGALVGRIEARAVAFAPASSVQTTRLSIASDGTQANALSRTPSVSADGRWIVFVSYASNIVSGASAGLPNVLLRDLQTHQVTLIAALADLPRLTPDGRYVSYKSYLDGTSLRVLDRQTGVTSVLPSANSISDDFRYVVSATSPIGCPTISVADRQTGQTTTVGEGGSPVISGDGRFVTYYTVASCARGEGAWVTDLATLSTTRVLAFAGVPRLIRANRYLLFSRYLETAGSALPSTIVVDATTGQTLVADSLAASVSSSGRYIGYVNPSADRHDFYVYDQQTTTLTRVSAPASGAAANGDSGDSALDDSGRAFFTSAASNLVADDTNGANDLFLAMGGIDAAVPTEPRGLTATVTAAGSATLRIVNVSWIPPATGGAPTSYQVEAGSVSGASDLANFSNGASTSLSAPVRLGMTIFVRVRAVNASGVSLPSNEINFTAGFGTVPGPPSGLSFNAAHGTASLFWVAPPTGDRPMTYLIEAGSSSGAANLASVGTRSSETVFSASAGAGTYFVRVRAVNGAGIGPPSNEVALSLPGSGLCLPPQSPPTALTGAVSGSTVTLDFGRSFATTSVVQAGTTAGASDLGSWDIGSSTPAVFQGVAAGTYYVRVRGRDFQCGLGPASNEVTITVR
jgi:hypothetical protein